MYCFLKAVFFYLVPSLLLCMVFLIYPLLRTFYLSKHAANVQGTPVTFVDIENFTYVLTSPAFLTSAKSLFLTVPIGVILALCLALFTNSKLQENRFFCKLFSSTIGMSIAASFIILLFIYNTPINIINYILIAIGYFEIDPSTALLVVSSVTIWMNAGLCFIILLGGLQKIDSQLYESASIAGVSGAYKLWKIIIPMLSPTLFYVITAAFINAFQTFSHIKLLIKGGPIESTNVIHYPFYKDAFIYHFGFESVPAVILFFCILLITIVQFKFNERKLHY